ncbi:MAG: hypothetical protein QOE26_294 [Verrucomicrobiota bacterium]
MGSKLNAKSTIAPKKSAARKEKAPPAKALHKVVAYQIHEDDTAPIRPARRERKWMEDADRKFPYRCLPLVVANQYGWEILSTHHLRAIWDGTSNAEGLYIENLSGDGTLHATSHFGEGVLTFQIPFLFQTPEGWNLMVRGPTNSPKDGIAPLDGIVETDWTHSTFTMNWRFTRACTIEFTKGEPICLFFPIQRGALEKFHGELRTLESNREFEKKYREWSAGRDRFLFGLEKGKPHIVSQGWQKEYFQDARGEKKSLARPFVNEISWTEPPAPDGNHDGSAKK